MRLGDAIEQRLNRVYTLEYYKNLKLEYYELEVYLKPEDNPYWDDICIVYIDGENQKLLKFIEHEVLQERLVEDMLENDRDLFQSLRSMYHCLPVNGKIRQILIPQSR